MSNTHKDQNGEATQSPEQDSVSSQPSSPERPRRSRIRFPTELENSNVTPSSLKDSQAERRPTQRNLYPGLSAASSSTAASAEDDEEFAVRRRVRSTNSDRSAAYSRTQFVAGPGRSRQSGRRAASQAMYGQEQRDRGVASLGSSPLSQRSMLPDEEGDDDVEDPGILADLQKALQHKAEVEQRLKEAKNLPHPIPTGSLRSSRTFSHPTLQGSSTIGRSEPSTPVRNVFVDFSPSVGETALHPIPTSNDDGATLDWSGSPTPEDDKRERKWSMPHLTRKPSKDKWTPVSRKRELEKQSTAYSDKLAAIKGKATPQTEHKADIVKDELQRRYSALELVASEGSDRQAFNSLDVVRWMSKQSASVKSVFCDVSSRPWLRHLTKKSESIKRQLSPWYLTAATVDEFLRTEQANGFMQFSAPSQNSVTNRSDGDSSYLSTLDGGQERRSRPTSFHSVDMVSMRRRSEDHVSFGPTVQSRRDSVGTDSRHSTEAQTRKWRKSFAGYTHDSSAQSSMKSRQRKESAELSSSRASPVSTRSPLQNFVGIRKRTRLGSRNSDDGQSSNVDSIEEHDPIGKKQDERKRSRFHLSLDIRGPHGSADDLQESPLTIDDLRTDARRPKTSNPTSAPQLPPPPNTGTTAGQSSESKDVFSETPSPPPSRIGPGLGSPIDLSRSRKPLEKRSIPMLSLPFPFQTPAKRPRDDRRTEVHDHALYIEYTRKKETLDELITQNVRLKSIVTNSYRTILEYDETNQAIAEKLDMPYDRLPPEVLKALSQDPYHLHGEARRLKGWQSVDAIRQHRKENRDVLESFVSSMSSIIKPFFLSETSVYEKEISSLSAQLERLEKERKGAVAHAKNVHALLAKVKALRDEIRPEYEEASIHTSANYPELVRLETLLDEFINQRNQLWKLGEASLSFFLTSIAPLMKTFGRPIWDELHDFLVIPLYRNSFSGEDDWYPVSFPHRSIMQWLRLLTVTAGVPFLLYHGTRFFLELFTGGYVLRIPSYIPSFVVYLLFSGVMSSYASFLLSLLVIVLCECIIVLWWMAWLLRIVK